MVFEVIVLIVDVNDPPNSPLCIINKNLSSFENLSDPKGPLSTIWTSQPMKCDVTE